MSHLKARIKKVQGLMDKIVPTNAGIRVYELCVPDDAPDADVARMLAEAKETIPEIPNLAYDAIYVTRYVSPNKVDGGFLYPDGRELDPGESWSLSGGDIQPSVR